MGILALWIQWTEAIAALFGAPRAARPAAWLNFAVAEPNYFYIITIMPKKIDHEARRRDLAEAAVQVIGEQGIDNTRLVDVARAANATTGTIAHYFEDKDALLLAALDHVAQRILDELRPGRASELASVDLIIAKAVTLLPTDESTTRDWRVWLCFFSRAIADPALARINKAYYEEFRDGLDAVLRQQQSLGELDKSVDTRMTADSIIASLDGIGVRATLEPEEWPADRQRAQLESMLRPMLPKPAPNR